MSWIANKGQVIQIVLAAASCLVAGIKAWPELKGNEFLSLGAILFYAVALLVIVLTIRALVGHANKSTLPAPVEAQHILKLLSATLDPRATDPGINYKAKLWCVFTNQSDKMVKVFSPKWLTVEGDVGLQSPAVFRYQLEHTLGSWRQGRWDKQELKTVQVEPGQSFRMWIGLDTFKPHEYLEEKKRTVQLGTLIVPIRVDGHEYTWEERL